MSKPDLVELRRLVTVYPGETAEPWQLALLASKVFNCPGNFPKRRRRNGKA